ncbi:bifunctional hydroxymethylpyrimidine kinase/phosphomethylpyrimidine kinase [Lachnospira pectinoschiza]|uniref:Hydroxymethylpyrimidine/phosphomethylpyrimidine kinase n=1 Tax=Lachnospira pectinoschiza TaxID=28052 RepID=A0A1G9ZRQ7_9FIRM|nr:bifunctional hydroxymethylpyrimidine kinase/phosphomethylpyrimidine kinase [Lachnospira pectinoschiza]SDN24282.1 hydroxymethylpyrimidine/phosphomethylpyrimidine kinase [Lachnospira pectinoschiza]
MNKDKTIEKKKIPCALTIAGSDCSGGAGIQADIKTMLSLGVYASSIITSLTAQNTLGVRDIFDLTRHFLDEQFDAVFTDIYPDAVKIGMVSNKEIVEGIVENLKKYKAKKIVVDPVMVSTSGSVLLQEDAISILVNELIPLATMITPNIPEASKLSGLEIKKREDMIKAAYLIDEKYKGKSIASDSSNLNGKCNKNNRPAILIKGGHSIEDANDLLLYNGELTWFENERIHNDNTHGTGCTLSSAIASYLSLGYDLKEAIKHAKEYITNALKCDFDLGAGSGPLNHAWKITG